MGVELAFGLVSVFILVGVSANFLSRRFGIPEISLLILLGVLVGPVLRLVSPENLLSIAPLFSALAITIILFDGWMRVNIHRAASQSLRALVLAVLGFILTTLAVGISSTYLLQWSLAVGLLLGSLVGGSCSVSTFALLRRAKTAEKVGALLSFESTFTDVFTVVIAMSLIQVSVYAAEASLLSVVGNVLRNFMLGAVIGTVGGLLWLRLLSKWWDESYHDITTLSVLLGIFAATESLGGSGAMSALMFGLILGNGSEVLKLLNVRTDYQTERIARRFYEQISFMLRTFFFVYLGLIFNINNLSVFLPGLLITVILLAIRGLAVLISTTGDSIMRMDWSALTLIFPRGLAAAVLGLIAVQSGYPDASGLIDVVLAVIVLSDLGSSVAVSLMSIRPRGKLKAGTRAKKEVRVRERPVVATGRARAYEMWFRKALVRFLLRSELKGELDKGTAWVVDEFTVGSIRPMLCLESKGRFIVYEAVVGFEQLKLLPEQVKEYQAAGFKGELRAVVDAPTAYRFLPRLVLVEKFCNEAEERLGFAVHLFTLDMRKKRLLPVAQLREALMVRGNGRTEKAAALVKATYKRLITRVSKSQNKGDLSELVREKME